jgi:hypothetical protein
VSVTVPDIGVPGWADEAAPAATQLVTLMHATDARGSHGTPIGVPQAPPPLAEKYAMPSVWQARALWSDPTAMHELSAGQATSVNTPAGSRWDSQVAPRLLVKSTSLAPAAMHVVGVGHVTEVRTGVSGGSPREAQAPPSVVLKAVPVELPPTATHEVAVVQATARIGEDTVAERCQSVEAGAATAGGVLARLVPPLVVEGAVVRDAPGDEMGGWVGDDVEPGAVVRGLAAALPFRLGWLVVLVAVVAIKTTLMSRIAAPATKTRGPHGGRRISAGSDAGSGMAPTCHSLSLPRNSNTPFWVGW